MREAGRGLGGGTSSEGPCSSSTGTYTVDGDGEGEMGETGEEGTKAENSFKPAVVKQSRYRGRWRRCRWQAG